MRWTGGATYEGGFRGGKPYGYGVFITPDGRSFRGANMGRVMALAVASGGIAWPARHTTVGEGGRE